MSSAQQLMESQRYSVGAKITQNNNPLSHGGVALNPAKSQANIVNSVSGVAPLNSKSIDTAVLKQSQRRLVSSGQKNMRHHNVQSKHQRGQGQPMSSQPMSMNAPALHTSQGNLSSTAGGNVVKYGGKSANYSFKTSAKNLSNTRAESRKIDSNRVTGSNRNPLQGNVSSSVQVQSVRQLAALSGNPNPKQHGGITQKRSYAVNNSTGVSAGGRKYSHQSNKADMFYSMGTEQYQQKLLGGGPDDGSQQLRTAQLLASEMAPLDISGRGGSRKKDESKHMLALNKKLIKPLTGNKNQQSQQSLAFSNPQINQLMGGSALQQDGGLGDASQPDSLDKIPSLNFMSVGNNHQQHQSQKIRIPKHALGTMNKRNPMDISAKGSFVSQRSNNKSSSQQKHAKKNNQQLQQLHGHGGGGANSQTSRFNQGASANNSVTQSLVGLNGKLKGTATREGATNADRRPMLTAIAKPRYAGGAKYDDNTVTGNTESTIQGSNGATIMTSSKGNTVTQNSERQQKKSYGSSSELQQDKHISKTASQELPGHGQQKSGGGARSQSRTIGQFIPMQQSNSTNNNQSQNQHMHLSGTQQRAHILKQSKSNITSKTIGLMQQRMLKTASNQDNINAASQGGLGAQYISSHKPVGTADGVKINPLMSNDGLGLPPMGVLAAGNVPNNQSKRSRGLSGNGTTNMLSSKLPSNTNENSLSKMLNDVQLTPQTSQEEMKKQKLQKQQKSAANFPHSQANQLTPYQESVKLSSAQQDHQKNAGGMKQQSPMNSQKLQQTPNSNNTTGVIMGSRDYIQPQNDSLVGENLTYRSENQKNPENSSLVFKQHKVQKKLNNLLTQAQALQQDGEEASKEIDSLISPIQAYQLSQSEKQPLRTAGGNQILSQKLDTRSVNQGGLLLPLQQPAKGTQDYSSMQQQVVIPTQQLIRDQERERNDTIPEEPTISMDEFQSNQASFTANAANPSAAQDAASIAGFNTGLKNAQSTHAKQAAAADPFVPTSSGQDRVKAGTQQQQQATTTKYMDSQSIQKQREGEIQHQKCPEEPAGPASSLNRKRDNNLMQSSNFNTSKNQSSDLNSIEAAASVGLKQSVSQEQHQQHQNTADGNQQQQQIMNRLSDRLSQNPMKQQLQNSGMKAKLQLSSSNKVGSNDGDNLRKIDSPNDDLDDKDSDECEQGVPDENPKLAQVKSMGLNPKNQLQNSASSGNNLAQRAQRNQQINQPGGDKTNRAPSKDSGQLTDGKQASQQQSSSFQDENQWQPRPSVAAAAPQNPPQQQAKPVSQQIKKVEDQVAQFAYLTRPGKTSDGVSKTNQDNFFVVKNFAKIENLWYFGVCDGHGQNGHYVSEYCKNKLALDIMEVDIQMREQTAMRHAKQKQLQMYEMADQKNNSSFDSQQDPAVGMQKTGNSFYRKQSHDGTTEPVYNELGESIQASAQKASIGSKRKSQDERNIELGKLKSQMMKQIQSNLLCDGAKLNRVFTEGFRKNDNGLKHQGFGFEFSGTTIVTAMVQGNRIVTANAGDSRATLGCLRSKDYQMTDTNIESRALSVEANDQAWFTKMITRDHKPDDPDEAERITANNGRIESYKGRYGENVGPARVWLKNEQYPGLAMSRSIGDACAHSVGVSALPEIFEFMTDDEDKFLVLASDGVWEFLSNAEVIDLVVPFWHRNDLKGACSTVVRESVAAWEREEDSIDDITCIIVFFKRTGPTTDYSQVHASQQHVGSSQQRKGGPRESSQNGGNHNNNNSGPAGDGRQPKGNQYQHRGRQLRKSKDASSTGAKK